MQLLEKHLVATLTLTMGLSLSASQAMAVEGGTPAYLLGSRDSFAGIVPGPGTYVGMDLITFSGDIAGLSLGGLPIEADTDVDVNLIKVSITHVFDAQLWGGTPALNFNIPILDAGIGFQAVRGPIAGADIKDDTSGVGDITITPLVGWHSGMLHYSAGLSLFAPTGSYDTASIDVPGRSISALSNGKNVWSMQPVFAMTHFNPTTGLEFSGATSLLFSEKNDATDYQTGAAFTLESTAMQHLPSGWAFGASGYWYEQLEDDSGTGADNTRNALDADSLRARVFGLGPIVTFSDEMFGQPVNFKLKYFKEFGAKRRFESDVLWFNATITF